MQRRIRILRIVTSLRVSGPALQAILLSAALNNDTYETQLVIGDTAHDADSMLAAAAAYGVTPTVIPMLNLSWNPITHVRALLALIRLMRAWQPDVVHTHLTTAGFWGRLAARWVGVPVVVHTLHEHPIHGYYSALQTGTYITLERLMARFTDSIITLSERLRREIADRYRITRKSTITVLPLGFDLSAFATMPRHHGQFRTAWHITADAPLIGIIGRLIPVKNHALFLQAAVRVADRLPTARFAIIGDGLLHASLQSQVQALGLADRVIFCGWQTDMPAVYSDLDVLVLSSWNEGTPVPIIEALAAGCPVVATEVGGVADLLDNGTLGRLVASDDDAALAQAILETLQHPPDAAPARQAMLSRYSLERLTADLTSLYRGLLARRSA